MIIVWPKLSKSCEPSFAVWVVVTPVALALLKVTFTFPTYASKSLLESLKDVVPSLNA